MYYIYHIPGVKIGVTDNLERRMRRQGNPNYEVLEEHTCVYEVSNRELELQKEYGYRVDDIPYFKTLQAVSAGGKVGGKIAGKINGKIAGKISGKRPKLESMKLTYEQADEIRSKYQTSIYSQQKLANEYNVSRACVQHILANRTYTKKGHPEE